MIVSKEGLQYLSLQKDPILTNHVRDCRDCSDFIQDLALIHQSLKNLKIPLLSPEIDDKTKKRCVKELVSNRHELKFRPAASDNVKIPKMVLIALLILTVLTMVISAPVIVEYLAGGEMSTGSFFIFILIIQNSLMLFLSPLLVFKYEKIRPLITVKNG